MSPGSRWVDRMVGALVWRTFVSTAYTTGLTLLIPFVAVRLLPSEFRIVPVGTSPVLLWVAVGLIAAALLVRLWASRTLSGTLRALGWLTFVPGLIGLVAGVFGREALLERLARTIPHFPEVRPAVELYLDRAVPQVRYLTVGFFAAGILMLLAGRWLQPRRPPGT